MTLLISTDTIRNEIETVIEEHPSEKREFMVAHKGVSIGYLMIMYFKHPAHGHYIDNHPEEAMANNLRNLGAMTEETRARRGVLKVGETLSSVMPDLGQVVVRCAAVGGNLGASNADKEPNQFGLTWAIQLDNQDTVEVKFMVPISKFKPSAKEYFYQFVRGQPSGPTVKH
jgi:hypothetical protein